MFVCYLADFKRYEALSGANPEVSWKAHAAPVYAMCTGKYLLSGGGDNQLIMWAGQRREKTFEGHTGKINCISLLNEEIVMTGSDDYSVKKWE